MRKRIAVLISGQGRNLQALLAACAAGKIQAEISAVISNRPEATGLTRARQAGIPAVALDHKAYASREDFDAALAQAVDAARPDWVVLAGFMRVLTPGFVRRYAGRLLNIHPSLLPLHPGLKTHEKALAAGDEKHGATVHFVTEDLDGGPAIIQGEFMVMPQDTPQTLAERVMNDIELKIYPQAVAWLSAGRLRWTAQGPEFDGQILHAPLTLAQLEAEFR